MAPGRDFRPHPRPRPHLIRGLGLGLTLLSASLVALAPAQTHARESLAGASWKQSLRESSLLASTPSSRQPNSVAAWKIARTQPGYASAVASATLPDSTARLLAREQALWSRNPAPFDAAHPTLGALFEEEKQLLAGVPASSLHGLLPNTPFFNYYRWRRSLDPARFDFYHPNLGPLLAQDQIDRNIPPRVPQTISPPPIGGGSGGGTPGGGTPGGGPIPVAIPEPWAIVSVLIGSGLLLATPSVRKALFARNRRL